MILPAALFQLNDFPPSWISPFFLLAQRNVMLIFQVKKSYCCLDIALHLDSDISSQMNLRISAKKLFILNMSWNVLLSFNLFFMKFIVIQLKASSSHTFLQAHNDNISISLNHLLSFIEKSILCRRMKSWKEVFLFDVKSIQWILQTHQWWHFSDGETLMFSGKRSQFVFVSFNKYYLHLLLQPSFTKNSNQQRLFYSANNCFNLWHLTLNESDVFRFPIIILGWWTEKKKLFSRVFL